MGIGWEWPVGDGWEGEGAQVGAGKLVDRVVFLYQVKI